MTPERLDRDSVLHAAALFGGGVAMAFGPDDADEDTLHPEERAAVERAVPKRRREFAAGRDCARRALVRLGPKPTDAKPTGAIPAGSNRAPCWPAGIVGSIAHSAGKVGEGGLAVAVVARADDVRALGVDVEPFAPIEPALRPSIASPAELAWCRAARPDRLGGPGERARLLFSAKESVYKALHPLTGVFLEFHDVSLSMDAAANAFLADVRLPTGLRRGPVRVEGRFALLGPWILTALAVRPGDSFLDG